MPPDAASLINECTNAATKAALYLSRLGLEKNFKNPNKPGRPNFKSVPTLHDFWDATNEEVNTIATTYKSRKAIREALRRRDICLDEIARDCLDRYGQQIWTNGVEADFVLSVDTTATPSKIRGHTQVAEDLYLRNLIYEHPSDERKIRLQVSAWIVQRACRKAEDDRREAKTPQKAYKKASTTPSSFIAAVHVNHNRRIRSISLPTDHVPDEHIDELTIEKVAKSSAGSKRVAQSDTAPPSQPQSLKTACDTLQTPRKQRHKQSVAVVVSPRKPWSSKATGTTSRKRKRSESLCSRTATAHSVRGKRKNVNRETPRLPNSCRTTPRRTRRVTGGVGPVPSVADANLELLAAQVDHDRDGLGTNLCDLLSPHNPGCHNLADIKRTTGLIDTIAINDAEGLRKTLGDSYDTHRIALDRWLGCVKTLVEFREITGLKGNEETIEHDFSSLLPHIKKKARLLRHRKHQEIVKWFKEPASKELEFTIVNFSREVASILLKMTSWSGLEDMDLNELLDDMVLFTKRLLEWFRGVPISSTAGI